MIASAPNWPGMNASIIAPTFALSLRARIASGPPFTSTTVMGALAASATASAVAGSVRKQGSGDWQIANLNITLPCSAQQLRQPGGGLLSLTSLDGQDDVFSLLEVLLR